MMGLFKKKNKEKEEKKEKKKTLFVLKKEKKQTKKEEPEKINSDVTQDTLAEDVMPVDEALELEKKEDQPKRSLFAVKDLKGKPVFLEDTGEKLGIVFDFVYDKDNKVIGYKIKDESSDSLLTFPIEQFDHSKEGLIFIPSWYTNALKIIERLEFKDKISPELTALLSEDEEANKELYDIFVKYDEDMVKCIDDARSLREMLERRLRLLEKQRLALKNELMDLTERRLIKDIDRKQFSEDVMKHRRKVNILDLNIRKCKELINRLEKTSFGVLGKSNLYTSGEPKFERNLYENILEKEGKLRIAESSDIYKEKYLNLKAKYEQLEEEYQELRAAVDKLFSKQEL